MKNIFIAFISLIGLFSFTSNYQPTAALKMGLLKYNGGGDWYSNPTALPNLASFCNKELGTEQNINNENKNQRRIMEIVRITMIKRRKDRHRKQQTTK